MADRRPSGFGAGEDTQPRSPARSPCPRARCAWTRPLDGDAPARARRGPQGLVRELLVIARVDRLRGARAARVRGAGRAGAGLGDAGRCRSRSSRCSRRRSSRRRRWRCEDDLEEVDPEPSLEDPRPRARRAGHRTRAAPALATTRAACGFS
jgi:hypothetical protein